MNYGRYQVVEELGRGSMGIVYKAHDPQIDRYVALKVLREDRVEAEGFVQRFLKEAKAMGWLCHPNIVTIFDVGEDHGTVYIAMELLSGDPLNKVIERRRFSVDEIVSLGMEVALTLDHAHEKGIVHRDIKPSNIVIKADGTVKVTDFGIAHIGGTAGAQQTQAGEILGTPAYMSPEQVMGKAVDGRSDLFSLGIILYELCTGTRPFTGDNLAAIFHAIVEAVPADPRTLNPDLPQGLAEVVLKCLSKKPEDRFLRGEALTKALAKCTAPKPGQPAAAPPQEQRKRGAGPLAAAGLAALIALGGAVYYFASSKNEAPPPPPPPVIKEVKTGTLKIDSGPPGAQVYVDGAFKGKSPLQIPLPVGKHEVRLTLADHHEWEAQIEMTDEGVTPLAVQLIPSREK